MQLSLPTAPPPRRAALQERSESHTNERASPTLRMIGNPQAPTYGSSPFPTKPSHILLPKGYSDGASALQAPVDAPRGLNLPVEKEYDVGDFTSAATSHTARTRPEPKETDDASTTTRSLADASFYTPVQAITARLNDGITSSSMDQATNDNSRVSGDIVQLPSVYPGPDVTTYPNSNARDTSAHYPLSKDSDTSLSSSNSTGTVIVRKVREGRKRASYSAFPNTARQGSSKSDDSIHTPPDPMAKDLGGRASPVSPISASSPVDPDIHENRNSSAFLYANFEPASQSSVNLQYPVIRPPSASASWVEHPFPEPRRPPRTERTVDRWNPHLSTVPSESTGSQSEERNSQSIWLPDSSRMSKASYIPINARGSSDLPPIPVPPPSRPDSDLPPLTNRALIPPRDVTGSTIRVVNEQEDDLSNMRPLIPGSSGSQFLGVTPGDKRGSVVTKPGSKASFFRDSIPAWARCFIPL